MAENRMELFIETLTGTAFELSCSPLETIVSIKAKIQYSEGIPVSQQHLIWKSQELNDDLCLQDYSINDGATLKLVLGMRGGPINTRQVSDTRKLKDLADYVERSSETGGSGGRPFTVLVFHDGDKVHMYTLMERGECAVSPLSGTISETSSVASIKNIEELDQEIAKENEVTREKIAQLQEQLRALNINRPKRITTNSVLGTNVSLQSKPVPKEEFHLPPIQRTGAFNTPYMQRNAAKIGTSHFLPDPATNNSRGSAFSPPSGCCNEEEGEQPLDATKKAHRSVTTTTPGTSKEGGGGGRKAPDCVPNSISAYVLASPDKDAESRSCSSFLPYISTAQSSSSSTAYMRTVPQVIGGGPPVVKYDPSRTKKAHKQQQQQIPFSSNHALSSRRFVELDEWLRTRPKTSPAKGGGKSGKSSRCGEGDKGKLRRNKHSIKNPLSLTSDKSSLVLQMFGDAPDALLTLAPPVVGKSKSISSHSQTKATLGSLVSSSFKALKPYCLSDCEKGHPDISVIKNPKSTSKSNEDPIRPQSGKRLPLIKTKKKSHKRCSQCSKKTGLATSYTCRCGKNFCASHRYAEVHHCSYDYKTEGRRLLQLNNPVVTASKLPKI